MTHRKPPNSQPRDPLPGSGGRGHLEYKDYTKFIQWTPAKIAIFTICMVLPYVVVAIAVGMVTAPYIGVLMLALPGIVVGLGAAFYWVLRKAA